MKLWINTFILTNVVYIFFWEGRPISSGENAFRWKVILQLKFNFVALREHIISYLREEVCLVIVTLVLQTHITNESHRMSAPSLHYFKTLHNVPCRTPLNVNTTQYHGLLTGARVVTCQKSHSQWEAEQSRAGTWHPGLDLGHPIELEIRGAWFALSPNFILEWKS